MDAAIVSILRSSSELKARLAADVQFVGLIAKAATKLCECVKSNGTLYSCGNGGSACDSMHLTEELVARYKRERPGMKAMHFADAGILTCWSNDYDYESVFERQAKTFCAKNDILIGISTSGNSKNVLRAIKAAKAQASYTIGLLGRDGGVIAGECDLALIVPEKLTERVQEVHITIIHIWMELLETS